MVSRLKTGMRLAVGAAALLGLAACANPQADQALYAQQAFVGMPKQTLLSCAGVPSRTATVDNVEYYTYTSERLVTIPGSPRFSAAYGFYRPWSPWYGYGWGPGPFDYPETETRDCQATFTVKDGVVQRIVYGGASQGPSARLGQCYRIVENCLALIPQQGQLQR
jgi:ABC-type glycerol-3-phosphate transport system substrate-binding protein